MEWVAVSGRLLLFAVFALAAAGKALDRQGTRRSLSDFGVPAAAIPAGALALPAAEALVAAGLLFAPTAALAAAGAVVLLAAFAAGIAAALRRGEQPDCHCFGQIHSEPAGAATLARNALLAGVAVAVVAAGEQPAIPGFLADRTAAEATAFALGALAVALGFALVALRARLVEAHKDLEQIRSRPMAQAIGAPLPEALIKDGEGRPRRVLEVVGERQTLFVFVSIGCEPCHDLLPELARWQRSLAESLDIVVMVEGKPVEAAGLTRAHGLERVFVEEHRELSAALGAPGTPAAVLVRGEDKTVASAPAFGAVSIEALVRSATVLPEAAL